MTDNFREHDPVNRRLLKLAKDDLAEARLLRAAMDLARVRTEDPQRMNVDSVVLPRFQRAIFFGRGTAFRDAHRVTTSATRQDVRRLAFSGPPDLFREEHSAFCYLMYLGYQHRFVDRHPGETPEEFLDRARKSTMNITRLVIRVLSQLYRRPPTREFVEDTTPEHIQEALEEVWSDQYNLDLLAVDRYTRLLGTVGVRPFFDPTAPGNIRLWAFLSHQLRVIPDPARPWKPRAVIERHEPFAHQTRTIIWTDKTFLLIRENGTGVGLPHALGRIPITFFKDEISYTSFFVEGRGRGLCDQNAVINGKMTDLNEIEQFQGFSVPIAINPVEDEITIGPKRVLVFRPTGNEPFGIEFRSPNAPLAELRMGLEMNVSQLLRENEVPTAALGADVARQAISGVALKAAMSPIQQDNDERGRLFGPVEQDLADTVLRIKAKHEPGFVYNPETDRPVFVTNYQPMRFPTAVRDEIARDEFDVAHGVRTPAQIIRERAPHLFKTEESSLEQWNDNLTEVRGAGFPVPAAMEGEGDGPLADLVPPSLDDEELLADMMRAEGALGRGNGKAQSDSKTPLLDALSGRV